MRNKVLLLNDKGKVICQASIEYDDIFEETGEIYLEPGSPLAELRGATSIHFCVLKSYMDIFQAEVVSFDRSVIEVEYIRNTKKFEIRDVKLELDIPTSIFFNQDNKTYSYNVNILDISSGGACIKSNCELDMQREYEMIIPLIKDPLILKTRILRALDSGDKQFIYGCRFQGMIDGEEQMMRQMVYRLMAIWKKRKKGGYFSEFSI